MNKATKHWSICKSCLGRGTKRRKVRKKIRIQYKTDCINYEQSNKTKPVPVKPRGAKYPCKNCNGTGLITTNIYLTPDLKNYPHIAIVGAGIGGVALAIACLHRQIPFTLYERDASFNSRSQGYGLTLQQANKAMASLGLLKLEGGIVSTRHVVFSKNGDIIGEWGMRKWIKNQNTTNKKRTNIHIARQALRLELIKQLGGEQTISWNHQLIDFKEEATHVNLSFKVNGTIKKTRADLVIGADGIRSTTRRLLIGEATTPLHYLGCIVILGICPLNVLKNIDTNVLDGATVFQTANGNERIYMMPYNKDAVMWQLSFPMLEQDANTLSNKGAKFLKEEAIRRVPWHSPIPEILKATQENLISGYPVYDRALLTPELLKNANRISLIGDAAHPMSPFKGQGANQALLDALALARSVLKGCINTADWRKPKMIRHLVLNDFEQEMIIRSSKKVKDSADAAQFLHTKTVLHKANEPRGRVLKRKD